MSVRHIEHERSVALVRLQRQTKGILGEERKRRCRRGDVPFIGLEQGCFRQTNNQAPARDSAPFERETDVQSDRWRDSDFPSPYNGPPWSDIFVKRTIWRRAGSIL